MTLTNKMQLWFWSKEDEKGILKHKQAVRGEARGEEGDLPTKLNVINVTLGRRGGDEGCGSSS